MKILIIFIFFIPSLLLAETTSVWGDDGSLTIQSETRPEVKYTIGDDSQTEISVTPQDGETIFIYGDELTIIQDTDMGIIQY